MAKIHPSLQQQAPQSSEETGNPAFYTDLGTMMIWLRRLFEKQLFEPESDNTTLDEHDNVRKIWIKQKGVFTNREAMFDGDGILSPFRPGPLTFASFSAQIRCLGFPNNTKGYVRPTEHCSGERMAVWTCCQVI